MSEKKLFMVEIEVKTQAVVAAETAEEAERWAQENYEEVFDDVYSPEVWATVYKRTALAKCPKDWVKALPYGTDDQRTVDQYFEKEADA